MHVVATNFSRYQGHHSVVAQGALTEGVATKGITRCCRRTAQCEVYYRTKHVATHAVRVKSI